MDFITSYLVVIFYGALNGVKDCLQADLIYAGQLLITIFDTYAQEATGINN
jgi:hypothetical protein